MTWLVKLAGASDEGQRGVGRARPTPRVELQLPTIVIVRPIAELVAVLASTVTV